MKKLLYIANLRLPTEKAYGIQIAKMCEAFAVIPTTNDQRPTANDVKVELVAPYRRNNIKDGFFEYYGIKRNFKFTRIWAPDFYFPGKLGKASVLMKDIISGIILAVYGLFSDADIIYSRDELPLYFLSFFKKNLVFECHRFSNKRKYFYRRFKNKNIKIAVITSRLKEDFLEFSFKADNVLVASDGVDIEEFDVEISQEEARKKTGLPLHKKVVMYTGHLFEWKGANTLLEAARLYSEYSDTFVDSDYVLFVFVGGTEHDVKEFKKKAEGLGNILILGHKPHSHMPIYLKAADVLVLPNSTKEEISSKYTSPLKLFEYMASGRPIVASNLPSITEILNGNNSFLVEPDKVRDLARGIEIVLNNPDAGAVLAQKAFEDANNHTWHQRVDNILAFVADIKNPQKGKG